MHLPDYLRHAAHNDTLVHTAMRKLRDTVSTSAREEVLLRTLAAMAERHQDIEKKFLAVEAISPKRLRLADGTTAIYHIPDHLIPVTECDGTSKASLVPFEDLLLGARFRYPGSCDVWVVLTKYRKQEGKRLFGTIAAWRPSMQISGGLDYWQSICSHLPDDQGGDCPEMVEYVG